MIFNDSWKIAADSAKLFQLLFQLFLLLLSFLHFIIIFYLQVFEELSHFQQARMIRNNFKKF